MSKNKRPHKLFRDYYGTPAHPRCINCGDAVELDKATPLRARGHYRCPECETQFQDKMHLVIGGPAA